MRKIVLLGAAALVAAAFNAAGKTLPPETPLIENGKTVVDAADFEGNMLRIPENRRAEVRMSHDRVATIIDNIYISRSLAEKARAAGLDKDPGVQRRMQQVQEGVLADLYREKLEKEARGINLEQRARELYRADQAKYMTTEHVYIQSILVGLSGRTRDMALERARQVHLEAKDAKNDFLQLAAKYSDDPDKKRNGGDLGYNSPRSFVTPVTQAINKMKAKGEVSDVVESEFGFHIIKFIDRKSPEPIKFETVKDKIIAAERERLQRARIEREVKEVRDSPSVIVHRANVEALVVPLDPEMIKRAMEQPAQDTK